jgi:hypothetical protein
MKASRQLCRFENIVVQDSDRPALGGVADGIKTPPKVIRREYRLPVDAPREKAICVYALAPYEPSNYHPIDEYVGSIPQLGSDPEHFIAFSLEEAAEQISKIAEMDEASVLEVLRKGALFEAPGCA